MHIIPLFQISVTQSALVLPKQCYQKMSQIPHNYRILRIFPKQEFLEVLEFPRPIATPWLCRGLLHNQRNTQLNTQKSHLWWSNIFITVVRVLENHADAAGSILGVYLYARSTSLVTISQHALKWTPVTYLSDAIHLFPCTTHWKGSTVISPSNIQYAPL